MRVNESSFEEKPKETFFEARIPLSEKATLVDDKTKEIAQTNKEASQESKQEEKPQLVPQRVERVEGYASAEHEAIGIKAFGEFCKAIRDPRTGLLLQDSLKNAQLYNSDTLQITISPKLKLTPGDIIALAGDFYGVADKPISGGKNESKDCDHQGKDCKSERFNNAYQQLADAKLEEVTALKKQIATERKVTSEAIKKELKPKIALGNISNSSNRQYTWITKYTVFSGAFFHSRYLDLATMNFDHFGEEAREAYKTGHEVALQTAKEAHGKKDRCEQLSLLVKAFTQELFACHFLTDLFAAGHMRTPRKQLLDYVRVKTTNIESAKYAIAGLLAKEMHDEEGRTGVWVTSKTHPEPWKAYGDDCYYELDNEVNREQVCQAVKAGLLDIYNAYLGKINEIRQYYFDTVPQVVDDPNSKDYISPLFKVEKDNTVSVRKELNNLKCVERDSDWNPTFILSKLKLRHKLTDTDPKISLEEQKQLEEELKEIEKLKEGHIECKPF